MTNLFRHQIYAALFALTISLCFLHPTEADIPPLWPAASVIYCIYPSIFSPQGNFAGVSAQLPRLKRLGITELWLMPITPVGQAIQTHPNYGSPYCVSDYFAVNPRYGSPADLQTLIRAAHKLDMKVILDEVLNHTSWNNALIMQHPEYYVHSDVNPKNPDSIQQALSYSDVAQLDYANTNLRAYMIRMLQYWMAEYHVDGFRFDSASNPDGPTRKIPADFWLEMATKLRRDKPDVLLLGECETPDLALKPFSLDYGWHLYDALKSASNGGNAADVVTAWQYQTNSYPPGMRHLSLQDDWDVPRDVNTFGGPAGALAAAAFALTANGIPLIYNGMEIGNGAGEVNPHRPIAWQAGDVRFPQFYREMLALRHSHPALQQGTMTWLHSSVMSQILTYERSDADSEFLIEINVSEAVAQGTIILPDRRDWTEVKIAGIGSSGSHASPPNIILQPKEFAIFSTPYRKGNRMSLKLFSVAAAAATVLLMPAAGQADTFNDNAGNAIYAGGGSYSGLGGNVPGFGKFTVTVTESSAGTFVASASEGEGNQGTPPPSSIDTGGKAFGTYAQIAHSSVTVTRKFTREIASAGDSFSLDFVTGYNDAGTAGVSLLAGKTPVAGFVYHQATGTYLFNGADTGIHYHEGALHLAYAITSPTTYSFTSTGAVSYHNNGTFTAPITGFEVTQTNSGAIPPDHNAYFNNLRLTDSAGHP